MGAGLKFNLGLGGMREVALAPPLQAPDLSGGVLTIPSVVEGTQVNINIAGLNVGGPIDSWLMNNLPAGAAIVNNFLTFTASTVSVYSNPYLTASNAAGSSDSNASPFTINATPTVTSYWGSSEIDVTSISIPSIEVAISTGEAPFMIEASAENVVAAGTRNNSAWPIDPHLLEYTWEVVKASDDSPIEYDNCITDSRVGEASAANPATDTNALRLSVLVHDIEDVKIKLTARGKSSGGYVTEYAERTIPLSELSGVTYKYLDSINGDDSNDGLDGRGITATSGTISYTDSTKTISGTGIGTGQALDGLVRTNTNDFVYLKTATEGTINNLCKIASISSNAIVLEEALGQNYTNIVPSTGPKETFDGVAVDNEIVKFHVAGTYPQSTKYKCRTLSKTKAKGLIGYGVGDRATLTDNGLGTSDAFATLFVNSGEYCPTLLIFSRIKFACNNTVGRAVAGDQSVSSVDTALSSIIIHDCEWDKAYQDKPFQITAHNKQLNIAIYGGRYDNLDTTSPIDRASGMYWNVTGGGWTSTLGVISDCDGYDATYDHFIYPKGRDTRHNVAWCHFRAGNAGYGVNTDVYSTTGHVNKWHCFHDNQQDAGTWLSDFGSASNAASDGAFQNVQFLRNYTSSGYGITWSFLGESYFGKGNRAWRATGGDVYRHMFSAKPKDGTASQTDRDYVLEDNLSYNFTLVDDTRWTVDNDGNLEAYGNVVHCTSSDSNLVLFGKDVNDVATGNSAAIDNNNFYAPNDADQKFLISNGLTKQTLAEFNAAVTGTNISEDPGWNDPANGDFSTAPTASTAPTLSDTIVFPDWVEGEAYSFDTSPYFSGIITSFAHEGTALPANLIYNTSTGVYSSTSVATVGQADVTGLACSASNSAATPAKSAVSTSATLAIVAAASGGVFQQSTSGDHLVVIDAVHTESRTDRNSHSWDDETETGYTGDGNLIVLPKNGDNGGSSAGYSSAQAEASYTINFTQTGTHFATIRTKTDDAVSNSLHMGFDGAESPDMATIQSTDYGNWVWIRNAIDTTRIEFEVDSTGEHTFELWMREDGMRVDKIVISDSFNYLPTGDGPAESTRV